MVSLKLDVASEESVKDAATEIEKAFGRLDILCNNAGYLEKWAKVGESKVEEWWKVWEVNVKGVYLCSRAFMPLILKSELKTILTTSSIGAHHAASGASG